VAAGTIELPQFDAGAHIEVILENGMRKSYSLANDPAEKGRYVTAVLREENGAGGSKWMHDNVSVGDELATTQPTNHFPLAEDAAKHILIAGGIGVTPIMAMGHRLKAMGADYVFHYCTKSAEETAFLEEVKELFGENVVFHHDGGDISKGIKLDDVLKDQKDGAHVYICGPTGLLTAARAAASHWPEDTVHYELFASAKTDEEKQAQAEVEKGDQAFQIYLTQSEIELTVPADKSIIEVFWENNVDVMYACEDGWCGNCTVGLLEGKADHRDEFLSEDEHDSKIQVCISRAMPGEKLVLDI